MMKAGEEGSQAAYPRASKVLRIPPWGKLEASGSLLISRAPVNSSIQPSPETDRNESCFSAVEAGQRLEPVGVGRDAPAERPVLHGGGHGVGHAAPSGSWNCTERSRAAKTPGARCCFIRPKLNVFSPK